MISMKFNEIKFSEIDYEWFSVMPDDEKIIFMYSMLLTPDEMIDFIHEDAEDQLIEDELEMNTSLTPLYTDVGELYTDVIKNMTNYHRVNITFINNYIIINSDSRSIINKVKDKLFNDGFIISRIEKGITHSGGYKFMELYELISAVGTISTN